MYYVGSMAFWHSDNIRNGTIFDQEYHFFNIRAKKTIELGIYKGKCYKNKANVRISRNDDGKKI